MRASESRPASIAKPSSEIAARLGSVELRSPLLVNGRSMSSYPEKTDFPPAPIFTGKHGIWLTGVSARRRLLHTLNSTNVPVLAKRTKAKPTQGWTAQLVRQVLRNPAAMGVYQPKKFRDGLQDH